MMMKIIAALAVIAVCAVASEEYKPPALPCAFQLKTSWRKDGGRIEDLDEMIVNDRFLIMKIENRDYNDTYALYRVDITKTERDREMIGVGIIEGGKCDTDWESLGKYLEVLKKDFDSIFWKLSSISWDTKNETEYDGKNCTLYYNEMENISLFVRDDFPIAQTYNTTEMWYEWEWDAPLDKFKEELCKGDFAKAPEAKYSNCSEIISSSQDIASSTQAFSSVVFAVIAACTVALF